MTYDTEHSTTATRLVVGLTGAGWHPAAWREPGARPAELLSAGWWAGLVGEAERGLLDLVTLDDALADPPGDDTGVVRGRLDAMVLAARLAPRTSGVGIAPAATTTLTEPFHVSTQLATIDYVSRGRVGWHATVSSTAWEAAHAGRRDLPDRERLVAEGAEHVEVVRRLWDSWEDGAEIRDAVRHRFVDRDKLHHIDFAGERFRIRGPSITPRPPQGQPLIVATEPGLGADVVLTDLAVVLDATEAQAAERRARLDALRPWSPPGQVFVGTPAGLADVLAELGPTRLLPAALPHDLEQVTRGLVPILQEQGRFRTAYEPGTLRERFGLDRPVSRYAA